MPPRQDAGGAGGDGSVSYATNDDASFSVVGLDEPEVSPMTNNNAQNAAPVPQNPQSPHEGEDGDDDDDAAVLPGGAVLEAAFYDPAYETAAGDGQGKSAVELKASTYLLASAASSPDLGGKTKSKSSSADTADVDDDENDSDADADGDDADDEPIKVKTESVTTSETTVKYRGLACLKCCRVEETAVVAPPEKRVDEAEIQSKLEKRRLKQAAKREKERRKKEEKFNAKLDKVRRSEADAERGQTKYSRVPEGVLIYRLDTSRAMLTLVSPTHPNTDLNSLVREMTVAHAYPSPREKGSHRRGICLVGLDGERITLVATEQRTAVAWLEALEMMLGRIDSGGGGASKKGGWSGERMTDRERSVVEEEYLNLTRYSNELIREGATSPRAKKSKSSKRALGEGGMYYDITTYPGGGGDELDDETLESIAKRRAVIKDSWDFYRMICSLLRDRSKYDECFKRMQLDPVYPYLNSMVGLNDPEGKDYNPVNKNVVQPTRRGDYDSMTQVELCKQMIKGAEEALPSLVEICKALAGSLGMEEVGVGPIKEVGSAIRKAERKYNGDLLRVTDYCRALLVVKDFATLLALLELTRDSFGPLIKRVKLSSLKSGHDSLVGGYRDCKINIELKEHVCEIQVHLWPMWLVCGVDGFRHYRHCLEYSTDTFLDPYDALEGLERKTRAEIIVMAEEAVAAMPLENLEWFHEKYILDYFAEVGLFMKHGMWIWAETTLRHLIKLRCESPDIGLEHHETIQLQKYLEQCLRKQDMQEEANEIRQRLADIERGKKKEIKAAEKSLLDSLLDGACFSPSTWFSDQSQEQVEEEKMNKKEVRASKKCWRRIREERFKFLDGNIDPTEEGQITDD